MERNCVKLLFFLGFIVCHVTGDTSSNEGQVQCLGTNTQLTHSGEPQERYNQYKFMYSNCTHVERNLELVFLDDKDYDLRFLSSIQEVDGYVLIAAVNSKVMPLHNLRIIRGKSLYTTGNMSLSLYIGKTEIEELQFRSLYEISHGSVFIYNNLRLCYENTIYWDEILSGDGHAMRNITELRHTNCEAANCSDKCPILSNTGKRHCWGPLETDCQRFTKVVCSKQCSTRCYGLMPADCCHATCAGGCTGPTDKDCWACMWYQDDKTCVHQCPNLIIYDQKTYLKIPNPNGKYIYGNQCVRECPTFLVADQQFCIRACPAGTKANSNNICEKCDGPCPKTCKMPPIPAFISAANIDTFTNCTIIDGNFRIVQSTFDGDRHYHISGLNPANLSVFETVKEITGYLQIQGSHPNFTSLGFLRNLTTVQGRETDRHGHSLQIYDTSLTAMHLSSLHRVNNGHVYIGNNHNMCLADSVNWTSLSDSKTLSIWVYDNKLQKDCINEGIVCDSECRNGCWGTGSDNCVDCANYKLQNMCIASCETEPNLYHAGSKTCDYCDSECNLTCSGPGPSNCTLCRNFQDGPFCVASCPPSKYPDQTNTCQPCHSNCKEGCTGPENTIGRNGCVKCDLVELANNRSLLGCLPKKYENNCSEGQFSTLDLTGTKACAHCHELCDSCHGYDTDECFKCVHYLQAKHCVHNCSKDFYEYGTECRPCDDTCSGCYGPSAANCSMCKNTKVYFNLKDRLNSQFYCTANCPQNLRLTVSEKNPVTGEDETLCVPEDYQKKTSVLLIIILVTVLPGLVLVTIIVTVVCCVRRTKQMRKLKQQELANKMSGLNELEPLAPSNAPPDMTVLTLILESELRKGSMVGSGAFGTVYKGFWVPRSNHVKIPVAIKVLQEGTTSDQNNELLAEARVMASVKSLFCVPIVGVCMAAQMMMVTPYMPLGCLLDYLRNNKDCIASKIMLTWCAQIATGMRYLEEKGIVHRDLAARNVLVQTPKHVRVTDFGLAKMLDITESQFQATGGKMPIKWLALECMQHRIFTHKSDVWSYGVTLWELFTYGLRPYENVRARDIPELLEKGERLHQPSMCTIDVYMILIKCWMLDANSRPSFKELADEFTKMSRDPDRYLVIESAKLRSPVNTLPREDLFRHMSVGASEDQGEGLVEGMELVEAEDYLQPNYDHMGEGLLMSPALNTMEEGDVFRSQDDSSRYSGLERRQPANRSASIASRYSKDPCKVFGAAVPGAGGLRPLPEDQCPLAPAPPTPLYRNTCDLTDSRSPLKSEPSVTVDENDYLTPHSNPANKYTEVLGEDYLEPAPLDADDSAFQQNPEYFDPPNAVPRNGPKGKGPVIYYKNFPEFRPQIQSDNSQKECLLSPSPAHDVPSHDYYNNEKLGNVRLHNSLSKSQDESAV